ncbi:MAG TPA: HAD family hydrolase [Acidimicrobiales bacterium]|nr:HAD family hydrolase [Acidimicrobiales bacterium]
MEGRTTIFDLDDTLITEEEVARSSLRRTAGLLPDHDPDQVEKVVLDTARRLWRAGPCHGLCQELGIASWEGLWATFEGGHDALDDLRDWARSYRPEVWRSALASLGSEDPRLAGTMADLYIENQRHGHRLIEGAARLIRSLRGTRRLGLLTNGPPDIQRLKLEGTGLAACFDAVVISGEVGMGKPDPGAFAYTLDRLGAAPESAVMVGDSWERDVLGSLAAGMSAVWIAGDRPRPDEVPKVTVVDSVAELTVLTI